MPLLPPLLLEKSASGIRPGFTGVPVVSSSVVVVVELEVEGSDSESGLQEKKTVPAELEDSAAAAAAVSVGFATRHSFFFSAAVPPALQCSASSRDRGKTAIETPAGEQSPGGPSGKKGPGEGAMAEDEVSVVVAAAAAKLEGPNDARTTAVTTKNAPFDLGRRGRARRASSRGMSRGVSFYREGKLGESEGGRERESARRLSFSLEIGRGRKENERSAMANEFTLPFFFREILEKKKKATVTPPSVLQGKDRPS